jgi:hypothetical protein
LGKVRRVGFQRLPKISYFHIYQKVERTATGTALISIYDTLRYNQFVTAVGDTVRRLKGQIRK